MRTFKIEIRNKINYQVIKTIDLNEINKQNGGMFFNPQGLGTTYTHFINNNLGQNEWLGFNQKYENISFDLVIKPENYQGFFDNFKEYYMTPRLYLITLLYKVSESSKEYRIDVVLQTIKKEEISRSGVWNIGIILNPIGTWYSQTEHILNMNLNAKKTINNLKSPTSNPGEIIVYAPSDDTNLEIKNFLSGSATHSQIAKFKTITTKQKIHFYFAKIDYRENGVDFEWYGSSAFESVISSQLYIAPGNIVNKLEITNLGSKKDAKLYIKVFEDTV